MFPARRPSIRTALATLLVASLAVSQAVAAAPEATRGTRTATLALPALPAAVATSRTLPTLPELPAHPGLPNFGKVSEALYRGAQPTAEGFKALAKMGVKTVVSLRQFHSDRALLAGTGLAYHRISFQTMHPEDEDVALFLKIVADPKNQPVFVHCLHGADRTGMMTAAYRICRQGWTLEKALEELPKYHHHEAFTGIKAYLRGLDLTRLRKQIDRTSAPLLDLVR